MQGLVLEGGGAKGAFHMGAVKAFLEEGYAFGGVAGSSIGAINGALIAQGDFELGYRWWEKADNTMLFDIEKNSFQSSLNKKIDKEGLLRLSAAIKDMIENKGLDTKKIREMLYAIIDEEKLRASDMDFGIVTVSVPDFKPLELFKEDIPQGKMVDYIMASANFPAFKLEPIDGKFYIDGGFYDNCPVNLLAGKGYCDIVVIRTFGIGRVRKVSDKSLRMTYVEPSEDLGRILNFDNELIRTNLRMGYYDAMRVIKGLKGRKYYIQPGTKEKIFLDCFMAIPDDRIHEAGKLLGLPEMPAKRMMFERVIPAMANFMGLPPKASYEDIVIGILEYLAQERGLGRFHIWEFKHFYETVKEQEKLPETAAASFMNKVAGKINLASFYKKESALKKMSGEILNGLSGMC